MENLYVPESGPASGLNIPYARGSYKGVSGRALGHPGWWDSQEALDDRNAMYPFEWRGIFHTVGGPIGSRTRSLQPERISDIRDGLSNTLAVGEGATTTRPRRKSFWAYSYTSYNLGTVVPESAAFIVDYDRCVTLVDENVCKRGWGSYHPQGINFLFCDGAVDFVKPTADMNIFAAQATIDGQEAPDGTVVIRP
jgi:prepilin-type processing-associated H-X9-DG protein